MQYQTHETNDQRGMVSFMVTMIMMIVITLIVLGFSQVTRTNQREALDRQLSDQAFYAAESGVNVTEAAITNFLNNGHSASQLPDKKQCGNDYDPNQPTTGTSTGPSTNTQLANGVSYTCVLVDAAAPLTVPVTDDGASQVVPILAPDKLASLTFKWPKEGNSNSSSNGQPYDCSDTNRFDLPPQRQWRCGYGVIRVELTDTDGLSAALASNPSNQAAILAQRTIIAYMSPFGGHSGSVAITFPFQAAGAQTVYLGSASCPAASTRCQLRLDLPGDSSTYYARVTSIYRTPDSPGVEIDGKLADASHSDASFIGEPIIDVTGKAQDTLRRIQVRMKAIPTSGPDVPDFALSSPSDICKHFTLQTNETVNNVFNDICE